MTVSMESLDDCGDVFMSFGEWQEIDKDLDNKIVKLSRRRFDDFGDEVVLCKHKHKKHHAKVEANTKGSVFSIITGIILVAIGTVITKASASAGAAIVGTGLSLIAGAVGNEINEACQEKDKNPPPEQQRPFTPDSVYPVQPGTDIMIDVPV